MTRRFEGKSRAFPCDNGCGHTVFFNNNILWNGKPRPREIVDGVEQWHSCPNWKRDSNALQEKIEELEERIKQLEKNLFTLILLPLLLLSSVMPFWVVI